MAWPPPRFQEAPSQDPLCTRTGVPDYVCTATCPWLGSPRHRASGSTDLDSQDRDNVRDGKRKGCSDGTSAQHPKVTTATPA